MNFTSKYFLPQINNLDSFHQFSSFEDVLKHLERMHSAKYYCSTNAYDISGSKQKDNLYQVKHVIITSIQIFLWPIQPIFASNWRSYKISSLSCPVIIALRPQYKHGGLFS